MPQQTSKAMRQLISRIQQEAFAAVGMAAKDVTSFFQQERERVQRYLQDKPEYLRPEEEILAEDPSLTYIELDLSKRFDRPSPTPFQHPYLYSWLADSWRYHCENLYGSEHAMDKEILLATAPTGRFNAMALAGSQAHGILLEDGLLHVLTTICNQVAYLLYIRNEQGKYLARDPAELQTYAAEHPGLLETIQQTIYQYITAGYSRMPEAIGDAYHQDHAIRHVLSSACWSFVFEHELFHLRYSDGKGPALDQNLLDLRYQQVWTIFQTQLLPHLPVKLDEASFRQRYLAHQEELFADFFALQAVLPAAQRQGTLIAVLSGIFAFYLTAELSEYLLFELREPGAIHQLQVADGLNVSLTAIITGESHPYAFARRAALISGTKDRHPALAGLLHQQAVQLDWLGCRIKDLLDEQLAQQDPRPAPHQKWSSGKTATSSYLRA